MLEIYKIVAIFMGTLIGAGFASGQEILTFFNRYGTLSWLGILITSALFGIITYLALQMKAQKQSLTMKIITTIYLSIGYIAMTAGTSALLQENYGIPFAISVIVFSIICLIITKSKTKGIILINSYLFPIILLGITAICLFSSFTLQQIKQSKTPIIPMILSSLLYLSYNSLSAIPVILSVNSIIKSSKAKILASTIISIITALLLLLMWNALNHLNSPTEIPILSALPPFTKIIYIPIMLFAMLTTAILNLLAIQNNFKNRKSKQNSRHLMIILGGIFAFFGFSSIISIGYSICGYLGFIVLFLVIRNHKK